MALQSLFMLNLHSISAVYFMLLFTDTCDVYEATKPLSNMKQPKLSNHLLFSQITQRNENALRST